MKELERAVTRLRLLLADIANLESQLNSQVRQFRQQLERSPVQAVRGEMPLAIYLSAMTEVQERLDRAERTLEHLLAIKKRAQQEVEALELTRHIEEAKEQLSSLHTRAREAGAQGEELKKEIQRLETAIGEYSQQAARSITERQQG